MVNLREVYRQSEEQTALLFLGVLLLLASTVTLAVFTSPLIMIGVVVALFFVGLAIWQPFVVLTFLAAYMPFEPFLLKWVPDELYLFARFFSEGLMYVVLASVAIRTLLKGGKLSSTPLNLPIILFVVVLGASAVLNLVSPTIAIYGVRQILRFITLFYAVVLLKPSKEQIRLITTVMFAVVVGEAGIALIQAIVGTPLDTFLLPSATRTFGEYTLTQGTIQFWDPGSRVFATLGRYDTLGTFLAFFLLLGVGLLYEKNIRINRRELWLLFLLGLPALALTYSRSSWFGFVLGFLFIGLWFKKDKRVLTGLIISLAVVFGYLAYSGIVVNRLVDVPQDQSFAQRFFEAFSIQRWMGEYYGLGRVYWIVQTLERVVPAAPLFGWGPGTYGGGAAIIFHNTKVYDTLGLPFGVYGTEGYIDNNWFSLWGETGTIGIGLYLWMYIALFLYALKIARHTKESFTRALALGFAAAMIAAGLNAGLATMLETRTLAAYLWMYGGFIVVLGEREKILWHR